MNFNIHFMAKNKQYILLGIVFLGAMLGIIRFCQKITKPALYHIYYFTNPKAPDHVGYQDVVLLDCVKIYRSIEKQHFTLNPNVQGDSAQIKQVLNEIYRTNYLSIDLFTPFKLSSDFWVKNLEVNVYRKGAQRFDQQLKLKAAYVSNLETFYRIENYEGKQFSDFDSVKIEWENQSHNFLMSAKYDLASIRDTVFVVHTKMEITSNGKTKLINDYDTVTQRLKIKERSTIRAH